MSRTPLSKAAQDARRPLPPAVLMSAEDDVAHPIRARARIPKVGPRVQRKES